MSFDAQYFRIKYTDIVEAFRVFLRLNVYYLLFSSKFDIFCYILEYLMFVVLVKIRDVRKTSAAKI